MWFQKSEAISSNHTFSILIQKDNQYRRANLVISGLPVLAITADDDDRIPQAVTLLAPQEEDCYSGTCMTHVRGQTSTVYPKRGYKMTLCNEVFEPVQVSLLGLRKDDDWILNALYDDSSKIREKVAYEIWDEMQEYNHTGNLSSNITYVELIWNHAYWGIYGLQEPIDKKQLSMNETDIFYKKTDLTFPTEEEFAAVEDGQEYVSGFRIKYPKPEDIKAEDWRMLRPYVKTFYYDINEPPDVAADFQTIEELVDLDNLLDYQIYISVIAGEDNILKNIDYCMRYEDGAYRMYMIPWDVNLSFGGSLMLGGYDPTKAEEFMHSREFMTLYRADNAWTEQALREKWEEYRREFLSTEHLQELAQEGMDELARSGAMLRDDARWPECRNSTDTAWFDDFIERHMAYLDECYGKDEWWREDGYLRSDGRSQEKVEAQEEEQCTE